MSTISKVLLLTLASFAVSALLVVSGALEGFELNAYDLFSRRLNPSTPPAEIVVVQVDQSSIDALARDGIMWPWPRQMYAPMFKYMEQADVVLVDILFTEASSYGLDDDLLMAEAMRSAGNVYLPVFLTNRREQLGAGDEDFVKRIARGNGAGASLVFKSALTPIDVLKSAVAGSGNVTVPPDDDGVYRAVPMMNSMAGYGIPHFALAYLIDSGHASVDAGRLFVGGYPVPTRGGRVLLRYFREPFKVISAVDLLNAFMDEDSELKKEFFKGKKVLMGLTAAGLYDLKPSAMKSVATGVDINATVLENLLNRNFIRPVPAIFPAVLMLVICFVISSLVLRYHSMYVNLPVFLVMFFLLGAILALLFKGGWYLYIIPPYFALISSFMLAVVFSYATEGRERRFVKRTFMQYMDKKVVAHLLKNPELIKPGGKRTRITVMFADLEGFTTLAESIRAEEAAMVLNRVLNAFTDAIIDNQGVVDKYIGDAVMAFWGAPLKTGEEEVNACLCALQCMASIERLNGEFQRQGAGLPRIGARIGIHTGEAIVGNLGSDRLFDFTAIGDTVNLTSRLEALNKFFSTGIIVSRETLKGAGDRFLVRELGPIEVKGKSRAVEVCELMALRAGAAPETQDMHERFSRGYALFVSGDWRAAKVVFDETVTLYPDDGPSIYYARRSEEFIKDPKALTEGWNIIKMIVK